MIEVNKETTYEILGHKFDYEESSLAFKALLEFRLLMNPSTNSNEDKIVNRECEYSTDEFKDVVYDVLSKRYMEISMVLFYTIQAYNKDFKSKKLKFNEMTLDDLAEYSRDTIHNCS